MKLYSLCAVLLSLSFFSCSHDDGGSQPVDLRAEAQNDRDTMTSIHGFEQLDSTMQSAVSTFFNGNNGAAYQKFLDDRIHFFITDDELASLKDDSFQGRMGSSKSNDPSGDKAMKAANVQVAASNIGMAFWLAFSAAGYKDLAFNFRGRDLVLDSPRVGLMLIGPGYNESITLKDNSVYNFPAAYRQSVLIHEARHSDCPAGLSPKDIAYIKVEFSKPSGTAHFEKISCGNMHSICPSGHDYEDLPACDKMAWGAYAAGAMFASVGSKSTTSKRDQAIMEIVAADQLSRLLFDTDDMFSGKMGPPDLSNQGLIDSDRL